MLIGMPRIEAGSVAENRRLREQQILDAAEQLLLDRGQRALTFTALSQLTGLARNSLYDYYASGDELIAAICERQLARWTGPVEAALSAEDDPAARLRAYVDVQLRLVAAGQHEIAVALGEAMLSPAVRERIKAVHNVWITVAADAFRALGHPEPGIAAGLVQGMIDGAIRQIHAGADPGAVRAAAHELLENGLRRRDG